MDAQVGLLQKVIGQSSTSFHFCLRYLAFTSISTHNSGIRGLMPYQCSGHSALPPTFQSTCVHGEPSSWLVKLITWALHFFCAPNFMYTIYPKRKVRVSRNQENFSFSLPKSKSVIQNFIKSRQEGISYDYWISFIQRQPQRQSPLENLN